MKKTFFIIISGAVFSLLLLSALNTQQKEEIFYYYFDEKIFIDQRTDRIFVKFAPDATREQLSALIGKAVSLQPTSEISLDDGYRRFAVLEAKDGRSIPAAILADFMTQPEVVSATYMFLSDHGKFQAFTDEFVVYLKPTTSYAQLLELAEKHHCAVSEEDMMQKNEFLMYVSKTSQLDARQMANLFHETGLLVSVPGTLRFQLMQAV